MLYATNKRADQPAHPRSLINTFVLRCLDSIILVFFCAGCAGRFRSELLLVNHSPGIVSFLVATPKTGFLLARLNSELIVDSSSQSSANFHDFIVRI